MISLARDAILHHVRMLSGMALATALACGLVAGGLAVGDGLREALEARAALRLGPLSAAVVRDAGFREDLAAEVAREVRAHTLGVLHTTGVVSTQDGRARRVIVWGVDDAVDRLAGVPVHPRDGELRSDRALADALGLRPGDRLQLRVSRPSALGRDVALTQDEGAIVGASLSLGEPLADRWPAKLALEVRPGDPSVVFVDRAWLQSRLELPGRINRLLVAGASAAEVRRALRLHARLTDLGLEVATDGAEPSLRTDRVVMDPDVAAALASVGTSVHAVPGMVGFVDRISRAERAISYSFVAGVAPGVAAADGLPSLGRDDIALSEWAATALDARPGDTVTLRWPVFGPARAVLYEEGSFVVRGVVPVAGALADPTWMPPIEGVVGRSSCREWNPGLPVDTSRVTDADEVWWSEHGGTPKAWISLEGARARWGSSLGDTTIYRFPGAADAAAVVQQVSAALEPSRVGLRVLDLDVLRVAAVTPSNDFGLLFAGFQVVLVTAALGLAATIAGLTWERRAGELGTLRALGWTRRRVFGYVAIESALVVGAGAVLGVPFAMLVAVGLDIGLGALWSAAVSGADLPLVLRPDTLLVATSVTGLVAWGAVLLAVLPLLRREPRGLLGGRVEASPTRGPLPAAIVAGLSGLGALVLVALAPVGRTPAAAETFFGAGALAWIAGLALFDVALRSGWSGGQALADARRRPGRMLSILGSVGIATFLVIGVGLGAGRPEVDVRARTGGTGGYGLYVDVEAPVLGALDSREGGVAAGLPRDLLPPGSVLAMPRVDGDEASCRQLGTAGAPTLLGVPWTRLAERGAFRFVSPPADGAGWAALAGELGEGRLPVIGDAGTLTWGLHLGVGDSLTWVDGRGRPVELVVVGVLENTVLQGALLVDEARLRARFPDVGGARTLLVDVPPEELKLVSEALGRALRDHGVSVERTGERLASFAEVEETYIAIFRALGGLGMLLATAGVGLVLARSVEERRAELALRSAIGFSERAVRLVIVREHAIGLFGGLLVGACAALLAAWPALHAPDAAPPVVPLLASLLGAGTLGVAALDRTAAWFMSAFPWRELTRERT